MREEKLLKIWNFLVEYGIATEEELRLASYLCGFTEETLNKVLFVKVGYRDIEQLIEAEDLEEEFNSFA